MRRSSSGARVSEGGDAASSSSSAGHSVDNAALPTFDPLSAAGRREAARTRSLGRAIHCIPLLLLFCALVLWLSISPVHIGKKNPAIASSSPLLDPDPVDIWSRRACSREHLSDPRRVLPAEIDDKNGPANPVSMPTRYVALC